MSGYPRAGHKPAMSTPSLDLSPQPVIRLLAMPSFTEDESSSPFFIFGEDSCVEMCVLSHSRWPGDRQHILNCSRLEPSAGIGGCVPVSSISLLQGCISAACQSCPEPCLFASMDRLSAFSGRTLLYMHTLCLV